MSLHLSKAELFEVTGKQHRDAQQRVLVLMGIEHRLRPDGAILVSRAGYEKFLTGSEAFATVREVQPDWSAM